MSYKYYLKKLTANELGYRNGKLSTGQMFYISKQAADFFPTLSRSINNDSTDLVFEVDYRKDPVYLSLVYHNDKYNREQGTRDEYRIYLNRDIAPDDFFFRPDDIIVMEKIVENRYKLSLYRKENKEYDNLNDIMKKFKLKGKHAMLKKIN
jgi:hypothetical protein